MCDMFEEYQEQGGWNQANEEMSNKGQGQRHNTWQSLPVGMLPLGNPKP